MLLPAKSMGDICILAASPAVLSGAVRRGGRNPRDAVARARGVFLETWGFEHDWGREAERGEDGRETREALCDYEPLNQN